MEVKFISKELRMLYETGHSRKYSKIPQVIVKKLSRAVAVLQASVVIQDVWKFPAYKFEHLASSDIYSMRLDRVWRLEMSIEWTNDDCTIGIIGLSDLTRHYGN